METPPPGWGVPVKQWTYRNRPCVVTEYEVSGDADLGADSAGEAERRDVLADVYEVIGDEWLGLTRTEVATDAPVDLDLPTYEPTRIGSQWVMVETLATDVEAASPEEMEQVVERLVDELFGFEATVEHDHIERL